MVEGTVGVGWGGARGGGFARLFYWGMSIITNKHSQKICREVCYVDEAIGALKVRRRFQPESSFFHSMALAFESALIVIHVD